MNAMTLVFVALCVFALAYRFYGLFIASRVLGLNPKRPTPAVSMEDGHDYHQTNKYVLFGHHFAAIAAAGPLLGPVLAAQFGFLPGALWIIVGAVVAGAVHDMVILFASVRHEGRSLSLIAESEIGKRAGTLASFAILFILILTAVDTGTRVGRYMLQEMLGKVIPKFDEKKWMPGIAVTSFIFTFSWGYLVYTGDISTIWPLFGMSNQLLATCALIVGTTMLLRMGKTGYAWVTLVPASVMLPIVMTAGYMNVVNNFLPKKLYLLVVLSIVLMVLMSLVFIEAFVKMV